MTPTITISNDHGGTAIVYYLGYRELAHMGYGARIAGECDSACTMVFLLPDVCAETGAVMGFHVGSTPLVTEMLWQAYPPKVREWLGRVGGLSMKLAVIRWPEIKSIMRPC